MRINFKNVFLNKFGGLFLKHNLVWTRILNEINFSKNNLVYSDEARQNEEGSPLFE